MVVIAGMQRSGSTFIFNVARKLLEKRGGAATIATNNMEEALSITSESSNLIIKTHTPDFMMNQLIKNNSIPCICTIRKPEDAIASWIMTFGFSFESSVSTIKEYLTWHKKMAKYTLNIDYKEIERTPILTIFKISLYLAHEIKIFEALAIWWRFRKSAVYIKTKKMEKNDSGVIDIGFSYYDKTTFFHRRHVSSIKKSSDHMLSIEQIGQIRQELREFIDKSGNYI